MVYFQTKNPKLCKFWGALGGKLLIYFKAIWNILLTFGTLYDHLAHFGIFFPVLVSRTKKSLATLPRVSSNYFCNAISCCDR
jgi:hypothetical protein